MRFHETFNKRNRNRNNKNGGQNDHNKEMPPRIVSKDFLYLAQQKVNIIDKIYQERAVMLGKINSMNNGHMESENFDIANKHSNEHKYSKQSEETLSEKHATDSNTVSKSDDTKIAKEKAEAAKKPLLSEHVSLYLEETPTTVIFFNKAFYKQSVEETELSQFKQMEEDYRELKKNKVGNDNFVSHKTQTYFNAPKSKNVQTDMQIVKEQGIQALEYEIEDELSDKNYNDKERFINEIENKLSENLLRYDKSPFAFVPEDLDSVRYYVTAMDRDQSSKVLRSSGKLKTKNAVLSKGTGTISNADKSKLLRFDQSSYSRALGSTQNQSEFDRVSQNTSLYDVFIEKDLKNFEKSLLKENHKYVLFDNEIKIYENEDLTNSMRLIERMLNQAAFKQKLIEYRNYPDIKSHLQAKDRFSNTFSAKYKKTEEDEKKKENKFINSLAKIKFNLTNDMAVNSIDINPYNTDLLLSSYGAFSEFNNSNKGLICLWTIKNSSYPEMFIETPVPAVTAKFSRQSPNLFACGFQDGNLAIYDTRQKLSKPLIMSKDLNCLKHLDTIWDLNWVPKNKNKDKGESLITISADGKLLEWNLKKTLEVNELKTIQQTNNPLLKEQGNPNNINFRYSAGFGFDFYKKDPNFYFISTEDGLLHRCSRSYKERYLTTYYGHTGSVYKVKCNPFNPDIFLSCSSDWTCQLWSVKKENSLINIKSLDLYDEVYDIDWNPFCSTSFANVCKDGRFEFWDLKKRSFDPLHVHYDDLNVAKTVVKFSPTDPVILTGNENGDIEAFRYHNYEVVDVNHEDEYQSITKFLNSTNKLEEDQETFRDDR